MSPSNKDATCLPSLILTLILTLSRISSPSLPSILCRTEIEQNIKWDATRRALALVFGCTAIIIATLSLADYLTKDKKSGSSSNEAERDSESKEEECGPKTAEELGLVPLYNDGTRAV